jgi:hypothetical protein
MNSRTDLYGEEKRENSASTLNRVPIPPLPNPEPTPCTYWTVLVGSERITMWKLTKTRTVSGTTMWGQQKWVPGIILGIKGGWRVMLTALPWRWVDCLENVGTSTSHSPIGLRGLLQGQFHLTFQGVRNLKREPSTSELVEGQPCHKSGG